MHSGFIKQLTGLTAAFTFATGISVGAAQADEVYLRVVDVGNALCVIAKIPGGHYMLYDAGNYNTDECLAAIKEIVDKDKLDLIVLSHSDADHVGEIPAIVPLYPPRKLVYTGKLGTAPDLWPRVVNTLTTFETNARAQSQNPIRNLQIEPLPNTLNPQKAPLEIRLGDAKATFVAGWHDWKNSGESGIGLSAGEKNNVVSIVVKFTYAGKSVLLTGDTIGRTANAPADFCGYSEKWMVEKGNVPLESDVLIGEHHGGDNSSSSCFIEAVSPDYVVLPAGRLKHVHPRDTAVQRYLHNVHPVAADHIFRTDRGDDQGPEEWDYLRQPGCEDKAGDDDIEIIISDDPNKDIIVRYRTPAEPCPP